MHDGDWRHHDSGSPQLPDPSERRARIAALLMELRRQGIEDERVLATMAAVPRERFVPASLHEEAWDNTALPIGSGQTISQPYVVALMTSALGLSGDERVLEIGTGSGYQTAILAALAREVRSIERHAVLAADAAAILVELGYENIEIGVGDGTSGWPEAAPYDRIIVTAAAPRVPPALMDQLSEHGGRLVIPVGAHDQDQHLFAIERHGEDLRQRTLGPVRFVPLIGRAGFAPVRENGHHA